MELTMKDDNMTTDRNGLLALGGIHRPGKTDMLDRLRYLLSVGQRLASR
jgi:hypothetical protein